MQITLDFHKKRPLCDQIQDVLRERILAGLLLPGDQLPAVRELATRLAINFNTVARAYRQLDQEGWISTQQGRGTFVLDQTPSFEKKGYETEKQQIEILLNSFFRRAEDLEIPVALLQDAFTQRISQMSQKARPPARSALKRKNRKSPHQLSKTGHSSERNSSRKFPKRRKRTLKLFHVKHSRPIQK